MVKKKINKKPFINIILTVLLIVTPIIILKILLNGSSIYNFWPGNKFGDEMGYYRVTNSFVNSKVPFGNYGVSYLENVSAKIGGYSAHGPKYTIFYGMLGKIFGWHTYSLLMFNVILLVLSLIGLIKINKLNKFQTLSIIILLFSYFPFLYFYISGMMETTQYILFIIYSAFLIKFLKMPDKKNYIINFIFIFILTLFRINYLIFYFPIIFIYCDKKITKKFVFHSILALVLSFISYELISTCSAPYPSYISNLFDLFINLRILKFIQMLFEHSINVASDFLSIGDNQIMISVFNVIYILIMLMNFALSWANRKIKNNSMNIYLYNGFILFTSLLIVVMAYEVSLFKGIRVLGPIMFLSILLLIYYDRKIIVYIVLGIFLISTFAIIKLNTFIDSSSSYLLSDENKTLINDEKSINEINDYINCSKSNNRWNNTITVPNSYSYSSNIIYGLPSCIGINYIIYSDYSKINKSKYILVDDDTTINKKLYKFILENDMGKLYKKK